MNTENNELMNDVTTQPEQQVVPANSNSGQVEVFNAKKYAIDKAFDTATQGIRAFNEKHPGASKKIAGATLIAAGTAVLMI